MKTTEIIKSKFAEYHEILVKNAEDGESYSRGLLKGFEMATKLFDSVIEVYEPKEGDQVA